MSKINAGAAGVGGVAWGCRMPIFANLNQGLEHARRPGAGGSKGSDHAADPLPFRILSTGAQNQLPELVKLAQVVFNMATKSSPQGPS